jgi:hypothetical protein
MLGTAAIMAAPEVGALAKPATEAIKPLVFKGVQVALSNPQATEALLGIGVGLTVSALSGQMQDVPSFTTGLPIVDEFSQGTQFVMTSAEFFKSIATPQTNVQPVNSTP